MPKIHGLIDDFPNLEQINSSDLKPVVGQKIDPKLIDNILGNRILYSEVIPETKEDHELEVALLTQAVKIHSKIYYHPTLRRVYIPESLLFRIPNLADLVWIFIQALNPIEINTLYLKQETGEVKVLGSFIRPKLILDKGQIDLYVEGKLYQIKFGEHLVVPSLLRKLDIRFESKQAILLGKNNFSAEVSGGLVGLIIDTS